MTRFPLFVRAARSILALSAVITAVSATAFPLVDGKFSQTINKEVRCGTITRVVVTDQNIDWLDLDQMLLAGKFDPGTIPPKEAVGKRAPADGRAFVILFLELGRGLSIGRYDYTMKIGKDTYETEAIARAGQPFDPRTWEIRAESSIEEVLVLFDIAMPGKPTVGNLREQLPTTISDPPVTLPIGPEKALPKPDTGPSQDGGPGAGSEGTPASDTGEATGAEGQVGIPAEQPKPDEPKPENRVADEQPEAKADAKPRQKPKEGTKPGGKKPGDRNGGGGVFDDLW